MVRAFTSPQNTAIAASVVYPLFFVELEFVSQTIYWITGRRSRDWNGHTWEANNQLMGFTDPLKESTEIRSVSGQIIVGGANTDFLELVLGETRHDKRGKIYIGFSDSSGTMIDNPVNIFSGFFDNATIDEDGTKSKVTLQYEHELISLSQSNELRYTKFCQEALFPGDLGFDWVPSAAKWSGFWGKAAQPKFIRRRKTGRR